MFVSMWMCVFLRGFYIPESIHESWCVCASPPPDPALNYDWLAPDTIAPLIRSPAFPAPAARGDPNHLPAAAGWGQPCLYMMTTTDSDGWDRVALSFVSTNTAQTVAAIIQPFSIGYNSPLWATVWVPARWEAAVCPIHSLPQLLHALTRLNSQQHEHYRLQHSHKEQ